jgi:hypothetical protein
MQHKGSCLCGKMQYETGELSADLDHCHCTFCQKAHGAAFGTYVKVIDNKSFKWLAGGDDVGRYQSSTHSARLFCKDCGSSLVAEIDAGKMLAITVATLDDKLKVDSAYHMFVKSKVSWFQIGENEIQYDQYPPYLSNFKATD